MPFLRHVEPHDFSCVVPSFHVGFHSFAAKKSFAPTFASHVLVKHLDGLSLCLVSNYMRTPIELLHKQALHLAGIFKSSKSRGLLVSLVSVSRSWIIKELQITGFVVNLLCSGRPAKFSVHAKSIYRSTDAKKWQQTCLVKKVFFLQSSWKHEDRSAFK